MRVDLPRGVSAAMVVHAAGESGPAPPGTYAVVLAAPESGPQDLESTSARLTLAGVAHARVVEVEGPYAGQLLALGIPPQPRECLRRVLSSIPLLR